MSPRKSVLLRSRLVPALVGRAMTLAIPIEDLLLAHKIERADLSRGEVPIRCDAFRDFSDELARRANDPAFGFHAALQTPRGAYGLFEYIVRNASTLEQVLAHLVRYSRLINAQLDVRFDPSTGRLEQRIDGEPLCLGKQGNEFSLAHQVKVVRESMGLDVPIERVYFAHNKAPNDGEIVRYFGAKEIVYGASFNGVDLTSRALETPAEAADPSLFQVLEERARDLVKQFSGTDELEPVRRAIVDQFEAGEPTAKRVAQKVGMSARTLHRRLSLAETTFRELVDDLRRKLAVAHLGDARLPIAEIAMLLGYSDGRAFARAFRRWTGSTPAAWRTDHEARTLIQ